MAILCVSVVHAHAHADRHPALVRVQPKRGRRECKLIQRRCRVVVSCDRCLGSAIALLVVNHHITTVAQPVVVQVRHGVLRRVGKYHLDRVPVPATPTVLVRVICDDNSDVQVRCVPCKGHCARMIRRATPCASAELLEQHQLSALLKRDLALELQVGPVRCIAIQCDARALRVVEHVLCAQ